MLSMNVLIISCFKRYAVAAIVLHSNDYLHGYRFDAYTNTYQRVAEFAKIQWKLHLFV